MRAAVRAGLVLMVAAGATGIAPVAAHADSATPPALKTAWFWSLAGVSVEGKALPADPPVQASLVPAGDLGVAYVADEEDAALGTHGGDRVSAVAFDLNEVPLGSTFSSFLVTMPLDGAAQQLKTGTPDLSACELLAPFADASAPSSTSAAPPYSSASCVKGTFKGSVGTAGGYVFDLTPMANDWSGGAPAEGILVRPTSGLATAQQPFSISFQGKKGILTAADYSPPPPPPVYEPPVPAPGPVLAPPPPLPFVPAPTMPEVTGPAPVVPAPQLNPAPAAPSLAAADYKPGALVPGGAWWLGLLGLLALLGLTAAVLGDPLAPVVVDARRRRFAEVVRTQARTTAPGAGRHARPAPRFRPA